MSLYDHFSVCLLLMACFDVYSVSYECSCPGMRMTKPALCDRLMPRWHTHTHTVASDTPVHTTSPHEVSDFFGLVSYQGTRRLLSKSAWILHYKVLKEVAKKNPPFLRIYIAVYTHIMHVAAWLHMCFDVCAFDRDNRKPQTNNSHSGWQKLCNAQCRYTISAERVPLTANNCVISRNNPTRPFNCHLPGLYLRLTGLHVILCVCCCVWDRESVTDMPGEGCWNVSTGKGKVKTWLT